MQSSQSMYNLSSISSPQYVPSHLRQSHKAPQTPKSSPPRIRRSSTVGRFGGPSFGTPKPSRSSRLHDSSSENAPPIESIYDYNGGSSFAVSQSTDKEPAGVDPSPRKQAPSLASLPCAVIIFGFPSQMTEKVLNHFSRFGAIEEHSSSAAQNLSMGNNWMKITYKDSSAAQQAVASNGTFVGGQYMVGCVFAPEDPLANVDVAQDDAMDIDPKTPPRPQTSSGNSNRVNIYQTPMSTPSRQQPRNGLASSTPGGKRIEVLNSDSIYKSTSPLSERVAGWMPGWLANTEDQKVTGPSGSQTPHEAHAQQAGWTSKLFRGLVDTIFGF